MNQDEPRNEQAEAQATIRLLQDELAETKRGLMALTMELEQSNSELEAFSYSVSHDLRAPLRAIAGYSRIVLDDFQDELGADGRGMMETILESVRDMGQLIDDLLTFSRLGRREMERQQLDVGGLARNVAGKLKAAHPEREILFEIPENVPPAQGDRAMIREVLRNLLGNAVKFTRTRNSARIRVECQVSEDECAYSVSDNGVGFDMRYIEKLFRVFQRLHSSEHFEGTGIGLALVQRIVHRHGGRVWAEGKENEGATFSFSLPRSGAHGGEA